MGSLGLRLRGARESRGLRLVDVAKATKVGAHHLAALEYGDFEILPEAEVVEGYVRTYAEHLGLDPDHVAAELAGELATHRPPPAPEPVAEGIEVAAGAGESPPEPTASVEELPPAPPPEPPAGITEASEVRVGSANHRSRFGGWILWAGAGLVVLLILAGWWWVGAGDRHDDRAPQPELPAEVPVEPPAEVPPAPEPAPAAVETEETAVAPAPEPGPPSVTVTVVEHGVGTDVIDHRLVGEADRFDEGTQVWFWTRLRGGTRGKTIHHVWSREGRVIMSFPLKVGGYHWRTQSRKTLTRGSAGAWVVEARDDAGRLLARREFACVKRS